MNSAKNHWLIVTGLFLAVLVNPLTMSGLGANQCPITLVGHGHHGGHHGQRGDHHGGGGGGHGHGDRGHQGSGHSGGHGGGGHHR